MSPKYRQSSPVLSGRIAAIFTGFLCAAAAWAISAGSVLAPEPADLVSNLAQGTGSTAPAVQYEYKPAPYVLWPSTWQVGFMPAGTPCSGWGLPAGTKATKRIEANGSLRRCIDYNPYQPPPANAVRPLPPMPMDGGDTKQDTNGVAVTPVAVVLVIRWPADWTTYDSGVQETKPYAGQPCSDFALQAGESSYKHIQGVNINNDSVFRCVANTEPIYID